MRNKLIRSCSGHGPTRNLYRLLDYGMRCGSLCEFSYQASLEFAINRSPPKSQLPKKSLPLIDGDSMKNLNESLCLALRTSTIPGPIWFSQTCTSGSSKMLRGTSEYIWSHVNWPTPFQGISRHYVANHTIALVSCSSVHVSSFEKLSIPATSSSRWCAPDG